jgi:hypothetical protein
LFLRQPGQAVLPRSVPQDPLVPGLDPAPGCLAFPGKLFSATFEAEYRVALGNRFLRRIGAPYDRTKGGPDRFRHVRQESLIFFALAAECSL